MKKWVKQNSLILGAKQRGGYKSVFSVLLWDDLSGMAARGDEGRGSCRGEGRLALLGTGQKPQEVTGGTI